MCFSFSPVLFITSGSLRNSLVTLNYFGGGLLMAIAFGYPLWAGLRGALPPAKERSPLSAALPWHPPFSARAGLGLLGGVYVGLGLVFLMHGANAKPLWFDASGITPLTARLFASPLTGLGLGLILVARAKDWRAVLVPAVGMATIGILGTLSLVLDRADFAPQSAGAWLTAATPPLLLLIGLALLISRPSPSAGALRGSPH